jgi:hypothetical protein
MFYPETIAIDLWNMALEMNAQTAVYGVRTAATTPGAVDTFTTYNLLRLCYRELTLDELQFMQANVNDVWRVWTILQYDLSYAGAPTPAVTYTLTFTDGSVWTIERKVSKAMNQAFECYCRQEPLGN